MPAEAITNQKRLLAFALLLTLLTGCNSMPWVGGDGEQSVAIRESAAVTSLPYTEPALSYYRWLLGASESALASEQIYLEGRREDAPEDPVAAVQMAMLHAARREAGIDQLIPLLEVATAQDFGPQINAVNDYLSLASLWQAALQREHNLQQLLERRERSLSSLDAERNQLQRQVEELEQQIEALKAIEQQLNVREQLQGVP